MDYVMFWTVKDTLIKKSLLAVSLLWTQAGNSLSASLVTDADSFAGGVPEGISILTFVFIKIIKEFVFSI
jgi:hypothetical protein